MSLRILMLLALACVTFLGVVSPAGGQLPGKDASDGETSVDPGEVAPPTVLIMPVVNYSEKGEAHQILLPRLLAALDRQGLTYLTSEAMRPMLRAHRIRSRGWIGLEAAKTLRHETGARFVLLASWDVFQDDLNPELALSLRILDLERMELTRAVSEGATGADFTRLLGLGTITDIGELADVVVDRSVEALFQAPASEDDHPPLPGCSRLALIPFDNFSGTPNAGDILTNIVLSRLMQHGYFVVEPGFVRELGLTLEVINRGGVDRRSAREILAGFGACLVMTGTVEDFSTARGEPTLTVPKLALGIRIMAPQNGTLYLMEELGGAGDDGDGMFQGGRIHALVTLTNKIVSDFLDGVATKIREDSLHDEASR
jgi:hypothetical protein